MSDEATEAMDNSNEAVREAKRTYLKAVRKLRDAVKANKMSSAEAMAMRNEWAAGEEIPKEYLD